MALLQANGTVIMPVRLANGRVILRECRSQLKWEPPRKRKERTDDGERIEKLTRTLKLNKLILG